ncbi:hypothetical protein [Methylovirgula sp. 4M-Z18]|nr:hypothetical protein DYH55_00170 [Methylovirgula sp. 4M-Z18]
MDQRFVDNQQEPPPAPASDIPRRLGRALLLIGIIALTLVALARILLHVFLAALFADFANTSGTPRAKLVEQAGHTTGLWLTLVVLVAAFGFVAYHTRYMRLAILAGALLALFDVLPLDALDPEVLHWLAIFF